MVENSSLLFTVDEWNYICLFFNAVLWLMTFFVYYHKRGRFTLGCFVLLLYSLISIVGIHLYIYHPNSKQMFVDLKIVPYIYLYGTILLMCAPIFHMESKKIEKIIPPNMQVFNLVCILLILLSLYRVDHVYAETREGLVLLFLDSAAGKEMYGKTISHLITNRQMGGIREGIDYISVLSNTAKTVIPFFWMYYFTLEKRNKWILGFLTFSALLSPLNSIASGLRYEIGVFVVKQVAVFLFILPFFPKHYKKRFRNIFLIIIIALLIPFMLVTISRSSGDQLKTFLGIERYMGESFIRFNNYGLDADGVRYGDRCVPLFKQMLGMETAANYASRISKYKEMKMNESVFSTFVGDFTLDFGPILTVIIFMVISYSFFRCLCVRNHSILFYQFILLYVLLEIVLGFFLYLYADSFGNIRLLAFLLIAALFKYKKDIQPNFCL